MIMGGKGAATSTSPPSAVCCMCGDHGLPQELFRCKACLSRSQHKYCSDLYPKEEHYRVCNWCLREEGGKSFARESTAGDKTSVSSSYANGSGSGSGGVKLYRDPFSSHLDKPIKKKPRMPMRSLSDVSERMRSAAPSPGTLGRRSRQPFRGKVRRYKLLEEFSN